MVFSCDVLDFRCILVSEIAGSAFVASLLLIMLYFIIASRMNWGFNTTVGFLFPLILIVGLGVSGFSAILAFSTIFVGFMMAWVFNRMVGNR